MTNVNPTSSGRRAAAAKLTPRAALRVAWISWLVLLAVPFVIFQWAFRAAMFAPAEQVRPDVADFFFWPVVLYVAIGVPAALFWRSRLLRPYWRGHAVPPRAYLVGMGTLWACLSFAGVLAGVACLLAKTLSPNVAPGAVALVLFLTLWPHGHPMVHPALGQTDDAEVYEEPR
jgi:hypothetical protein